ncbi:RNA polymerase sigma factor [Rhizosphaericola mali]|uniref:RNA polymerase sigma-70 factor n=1 Tax=Rhizosphaericola mali TaxID=2545455 RepID=A0A5P2G4W3_9BACT|nr:RNA polymerase sigma-70 factor [Rhizosphaericola mali]QES90227.1 RNA polymerase sigma-70 factor [Rhizosphaericola mali]
MSLYASYNDTQLLSFIKSGNAEAFKEIYERYWERMADYVIKVIKNETEAQDIVQEIFISIWKRREIIEIKGELLAYLLKSARNLSLRYIEKNLNKQSFYQSLNNHLNDFQFTNFTALELKELEEQINNAIEALPAKMQEIFKLSRFENLSYKEISERLNIADTTVKKQISNAIKIIKKDVDNNQSDKIVLFIIAILSLKK